jgi:hypothetical protein
MFQPTPEVDFTFHALPGLDIRFKVATIDAPAISLWPEPSSDIRSILIATWCKVDERHG